jgi:hypothetical protein
VADFSRYYRIPLSSKTDVEIMISTQQYEREGTLTKVDKTFERCKYHEFLDKIENDDIKKIIRSQKNKTQFKILEKIPIPNRDFQLFDDCLQIYLGTDPFIPHKVEERKKKFNRAFEELRGYL